MKNVFLKITERVRALFRHIKEVIASFSRKERVAFFIALWAFIISFALIIWNINKSFMVEVPAYGGSFTEGIIGIPRFINPLIAVSDADRDLTLLAYSGLMRATASGTLIPDLALNYEISDDGLVYTFTIKDTAVFHDGTPVTADDVIFTITKAEDSALKSPKRANWDGVAVEKMGDREIRFTLRQPYAPFLGNTTLGILPKHIWDNVSIEQFNFSQFNIEPVGSGPYRVKNITRDKSGIPVSYNLSSFKDFTLGRPYINDMTIKFYANEEELTSALSNGDIESLNAISPQTANELSEKGDKIIRSPLPRVFGVFFNQNQAPIFTDSAVRTALDTAVDRAAIIETILYGYGTAIDGPIPPGSLGYTAPKENMPSANAEQLQKARGILEKNGWKLGKGGIYEKRVKKTTQRLSFSLSIPNVAELKSVAEMVSGTWRALGADVEIKIFEAGDLNQNVIRPRKYDALLFGEIVGRDTDLFAFWHSSQRNDPGLNIALYASSVADKLLESARSISDTDTRAAKYAKFQQEIKNDTPAIFLYSPDFVYILPERIRGVELNSVATPSERFLNNNKWFIETNSVWKIFVRD